MDYIWTTAKSLTQAQKMMRLLRAAGIAAVMERSRGTAAKGCGYRVGVAPGQRKMAGEVLSKAGIILPAKEFSQSGGTMQEAEHDLF